MQQLIKRWWIGLLIAVTIAVLAVFLAISYKMRQFAVIAELDDGIKKIAKVQLKNNGIDYAIVIKCLDGCDISFSSGERKQFPAASLIKIPLLIAALEAVEEGAISLQDNVTVARTDITGGSGKLKNQKTPQSITIEELLKYMIASSDNTAANKVIDILGVDYIEQRFRALGLEDTVLARKIMDFSMRNRGVENYTSARDIAFLLEGLYKQRFFSSDLSRLGISFLLKQEVKDRLPRFLPKNCSIAHKTGLERGVVHDAGIIFTRKNAYIICVLVKNGHEYAPSKNFIALVSLFTYNLINK